MNSVTARAPGKVNLILRVGPLADDGYHPLVTVFQAVSLYEQVTASSQPAGSGVLVTASGIGAELVPLDHTNLVHRAATALADCLGTAPDVALHIEKGVPVAGGMAGGSADAAATLVACNELWSGGLSDAELADLATGLGSDVPFSLLGGTAIGTGRGHLLTPVPDTDNYNWVFAIQNAGLSTPTVFRKFDDLKVFSDLSEIDIEKDQFQNDLQAASIALRPELADTINVAISEGALAAFISGSGPTVAALAVSDQHAKRIAKAWLNTGTAALAIAADGPVPGARLIN